MFEIYGRDNCIWCDRAKNLLDEYNYNWYYMSIEGEENFQFRNEFKVFFPGAKSVPQIRFEWKEDVYENIGGYTELVEWLKHYTPSS